MPWAPTRRDFHTFGLPAAACTPESRSLSSVDPDADVFELPGHGLTEEDLVRFVAIGAGAELPAGLSPSQLYGVVPLGSDLFSVALAGVPVSLTSAGAGVVQVVQELGPAIDRILDARARYVDAHAKAYKVPFVEPAPAWAIQTACQLAALDVARVLRTSSPTFRLDDVAAAAAAAEAFCARLAEGEPMADNPADQSPGIAEAGARRIRGRASRDWQNAEGGGEL